MPNLRGHHLICLHFFYGQGYDETFVENLRRTLEQAKTEPVTISSGADDVCASCVHLKQNKCRFEENADQEIQQMDAKALGLLGLSHNDQVRWKELKRRIPEIFPEWFRLCCADCTWKGACEKDKVFQKLKEK